MPRKPKTFEDRFLLKFEEYIEALQIGAFDQISLEQVVDEVNGEYPATNQEVITLVSSGGALEIIKRKLGIDILSPGKPILSKNVSGTPGEPSQGGGVAHIYTTKEEGIYLRVVKYKSSLVGTRYDFITNPDLEI